MTVRETLSSFLRISGAIEAASDDKATAVAGPFGAVGERHAGIGREPADLEGQATACREQEVAAHRLDAVLRTWGEESLELDVAADRDEAQLVELRKRFEGYTGPVINAGGVR